MTTQESTLKSADRRRAEDRQGELDALLLHIAVSCPADAVELSRRVNRPANAIQDDLTTLIREGTVHLHEATLRTSAAPRIIAAAPPEQLRDIHNQVLAEIKSGDETRPATLIAMAESGCADEALLRGLVRAVGDHPSDAAAIGALASVARARGHHDDELRLFGAEHAAARGQTEQVLSITDTLLTSTSPETSTKAGLLAAGALIQNNRLERALALYRHVGEECVGQDAAWAVVAAVGQGDLAAAKRWRAVLGEEALTSQAAGLVDLADGLLRSISETGEGALQLLARSISALGPLGSNLRAPETPAALAALVCLGRGDPATAEVLLERALKADLGGEAGRRRHLLLISWTLMVQGRMDASEQHLERIGAQTRLCERDRFLYWCLIAGIARRRADWTAMRDAWHELRAHTFGLSLTLFDMLPLGEMMVVAARLHDSDRVSELVARAQAITAELGGPIVWTAPFHWSGVQAAFQANDPSALIPHANALVAAKPSSAYAEVLANAGQTWLRVLRREADLACVEASANALAQHGQVWDAARLAGQAALQHPEHDSALSLMQLAREINRTHSSAGSSRRNATSLTSREIEVAQLVLEGQGYRAIGEQLFISPKTVEHHVARIRNRLGATSRSELLEKLHDILS